MAFSEIAQFHSDLGATPADLEVIDFDHLVELAVHFECGALSELACFDHLAGWSFRRRV
jgi:hypothetical protein